MPQQFAPQSGGELLLNTLAKFISGGKQKKAKASQQEEMARILGSGDRGKILAAASRSGIPAMQQLAMQELLKTPKANKPAMNFGSGERGSLMQTAFSMPGTPEGQTAFERLQAPVEKFNPVTGDLVTSKGYVTPTIAALYQKLAPGAAPLPVDPGLAPALPTAPAGAEQLTERTSVIKGRGKPATADESKSIGFANRMLDSESIYESVVEGGFDPAAAETSFFEGLTTSAFTPDLIAQSVLPQDVKRYIGAKTDFITAVLRKESGAAIGQHEYKTENKKYFPQAGDGEQVLADKKQRRLNALKSMGKAGGQRFEKDFPDQYSSIFSPPKVPVLDGAPGAGYIKVENPDTGAVGWWNEETQDFVEG